MAKILGLDLGSTSIGGCIRDTEKENEKQIEKYFVVTFEAGMPKGKNGYSSLAAERRKARSPRNLIRARKYRKQALLKVLIENEMVPLTYEELNIWSKYKKGQAKKFPENENFLSWLKCDFTYLEGGKDYKNPYELRLKATEEKLSNHEFGRALYHIVQRRGYFNIGENNEKSDTNKVKKESNYKKAKEKEEILNKIKENNNNILSKALTSDKFLKEIKGKRIRNVYTYRNEKGKCEYEYELEKICEKQDLGIEKTGVSMWSTRYENPLMHKIWKAIIWQRPLRSQKGNIGKCTLETSCQRMPISHPLFEINSALQFINTIKYNDKNDIKGWHFEEIIKKQKEIKAKNDFKELSVELKKELFYFFIKNDFKFEQVKKFLDKKFQKQCIYNYPIHKNKKEKAEYDTSISGMPFCKGIMDLFKIEKEAFLELHKYGIDDKNQPKIIKNKYSIQDIWHLLFNEKDIQKIAHDLEIKDVEKTTENPLKKLQKSMQQGYRKLSSKAIRKIIPFLIEGYLYNEAVVLAKLPEVCKNWEQDKEAILKLFEDIKPEYDIEKKAINAANDCISNWKNDKSDYSNLNDINNDINKERKKCFEKDIEKACQYHEGQSNYKEIKAKVEKLCLEYQKTKETDGKYIPNLHLNEYFTKRLLEKNFIKEDKIKEVDKKTGEIIEKTILYHHSTMEKYEEAKDEKLPNPIIPSIKNPMFNKAMGMLKKTVQYLIDKGVQYLIDKGKVDKTTKVVVELARELNDNNKRKAIERYQKEREDEREKYREFIKEFSKEKGYNYDDKQIENKIPEFEIFNEQNFKKIKVKNEKDKETEIPENEYILKQKNAEQRYELWKEQKSICLYCGKTINISNLFSPNTQLEHTIPRSIFPCNEMYNKTIACRKCNAEKNNRLPSELTNHEAILQNIKPFEEKRDHYKKLHEDNKKPKGNETPEKRIVNKHYYQMHYDYWKKKVETFEFSKEDVEKKWVKRMLQDTQMISKYARAYLKTYFKKVNVQKGEDTAWFRKIFGIEGKEKKDRTKHTHHAVDAAVLTLIPFNAKNRETLLKMAGKYDEDKKGNLTINPFKIPDRIFGEDDIEKLNKDISKSHALIVKRIEENTLIYHHKEDKITRQTKKIVRKRGKIQYLKDKNGNFILDENGEKKRIIAQGDTIRGSLFEKTFLGKIKMVERDEEGKPLRDENGDWKFKKDKKGKDVFEFVKRIKVADLKDKKKDKKGIIVDPEIRKLFEKAEDKTKVKDPQGNIIRHVRIFTNTGKPIKERLNYQSKHDYKNYFYAQSDGIPYAMMLSKIKTDKKGKVKKDKQGKEEIERKLITISLDMVAKIYKKYGEFNKERFMEWYQENEKDDYEKIKEYKPQHLLKVGQKVLVLTKENEEEEYKKREAPDFQKKRLYVIRQFEDGKIKLALHKLMYENPSKSGTIGKTHLRISREYWNFLLEGEDFEMELDGSIEFKEEKQDA